MVGQLEICLDAFANERVGKDVDRAEGHAHAVEHLNHGGGEAALRLARERPS